MNIYPASQNSFLKAIDLLKKNNLPTEDVTSGTQIFVMENGNEVIGTIAVEYDFNDALLRSLSVSKEKRNIGLGIALVNFIEDYVKKQGVQNMFLLTTTAANFFLKRGYKIIERSNVSNFIKQTSEYAAVCPASASVMKKILS